MVARAIVPNLEKDWFQRLLSKQPKVDLQALADFVGVSMESVRKWLKGGGVSRNNLQLILEFLDTDYDAVVNRAGFPSRLENKWHQLPTPVQNHIMKQIDAQLKFQQENPLLTSAMFPEIENRNKLCRMPNLSERVASGTMTMIMIVDLNGDIWWVNQAVVDAVAPNLTQDSFVGTNKKDWWPLDWERCTAIDREICAEGEMRDYLFPMHVNETETFNTFMRTVPLEDADGTCTTVIKYIFNLQKPLDMLKQAQTVLSPVS